MQSRRASARAGPPSRFSPASRSSALSFALSRIVLNPKIDSKTQRRLQCSLRFADVFTHLAPAADPAPRLRPTLWNVQFPSEMPSKPRRLEVSRPPAP